MTYFLVQLSEHKAAIFLGQNNLSIGTIFPMKNSIMINPKLLPCMKEFSFVRVLDIEIFNLWAVITGDHSIIPNSKFRGPKKERAMQS